MIPVSPSDPELVIECNPKRLEITPVETPGVIYHKYQRGDAVVILATAIDGYQIPDTSTMVWHYNTYLWRDGIIVGGGGVTSRYFVSVDDMLDVAETWSIPTLPPESGPWGPGAAFAELAEHCRKAPTPIPEPISEPTASPTPTPVASAAPSTVPPRFIIKGGTAKERAKVRAIIKKYKVRVPKNTTIYLKGSRPQRGAVGFEETFELSSADSTSKLEPTRYHSIWLWRPVLKKSTAAKTVIHELAHAVQYSVETEAVQDTFSMSQKRRELQADCMTYALTRAKLVRTTEESSGQTPTIRIPKRLAELLLQIWNHEAEGGPLRFRFGLPSIGEAIDRFLEENPDPHWYHVDTRVR